MSKILIVDDIEDNVKLLEFDLEKEEYEIFGAFSGEEAIKKAKDVLPDIIILDIMMPKLDGIETCKLIKQESEIADIPIIMMSAKNQTSDIIKALDAGATDYITKPINYPIVAARLRSALRSRELNVALAQQNNTAQEALGNQNHFVAKLCEEITAPLRAIKELADTILSQENVKDTNLRDKLNTLASNSANLVAKIEGLV